MVELFTSKSGTMGDKAIYDISCGEKGDVYITAGPKIANCYTTYSYDNDDWTVFSKAGGLHVTV